MEISKVLDLISPERGYGPLGDTSHVHPPCEIVYSFRMDRSNTSSWTPFTTDNLDTLLRQTFQASMYTQIPSTPEHIDSDLEEASQNFSMFAKFV